MKTKLAIFDCDDTILDDPIAKHQYGFFFPNEELPQHIQDLIEKKDWDNFNLEMAADVNGLNISKNEIIETWKPKLNVIKGMDEVLRKLSEDHDIIIVSGTCTYRIEIFFEKYQLLKLVDKIFAKPSKITDDGKIVVENIPNEWGGPCKLSKRAICKTSCIQYFIKDRAYEEFLYVGDGKNDLCPSLNLGANARICPRIGYPLEQLLNNYCIQADIVPWINGVDLLDKLVQSHHKNKID